MAKSVKESPVSVQETVARWANALDTISNEIGEVSEGLVEAMPRHLAAVIPLETQRLITLRDSLNTAIAEMRDFCGATVEGSGS